MLRFYRPPEDSPEMTVSAASGAQAWADICRRARSSRSRFKAPPLEYLQRIAGGLGRSRGFDHHGVRQHAESCC